MVRVCEMCERDQSGLACSISHPSREKMKKMKIFKKNRGRAEGRGQERGASDSRQHHHHHNNNNKINTKRAVVVVAVAICDFTIEATTTEKTRQETLCGESPFCLAVMY